MCGCMPGGNGAGGGGGGGIGEGIIAAVCASGGRSPPDGNLKGGTIVLNRGSCMFKASIGIGML